MTRYQQNHEIAWRRIDRDVILIDPGSAEIRQLNPVAGHVWEELGEPRTSAELLESVVRRFDVSRETAAEDVAQFLEKLVERNLAGATP